MKTLLGTNTLHGFAFDRDETKNSLAPISLFGLPLAGLNGSGKLRGLAALHTSRGRFDSAGWTAKGDNLRAEFAWEEAGLRWVSRWTFDADTGLIVRRDTLTNTGSDAVTIHRAQARFVFAPGHYRAYTQESLWCHEFQGGWRDVPPGGVSLTCEQGRTTENVTPYLALSTGEGQPAVAFNLIPNGNWSIHLRTTTVLSSLPFLSVEMGLADENLALELAPGASLELPVLLVQDLPDGRVESGTAPIHRWAQKNLLTQNRAEPPIVYNTWLEFFDLVKTKPEQLRAQVLAAKECGCEIFTVDAGWFGSGGPDGLAEVGDWRECGRPCFPGGLKAFADEVRAAGLGFGLWMEPERAAGKTPIRAAHPEYFRGSLVALERPAAYAWLKGEMLRLIKTYGLAWMKIDFNFHGGVGADLAEGHAYTAAWHRLLGEIRAAHPECFLEACASGGMRCDLGTLAAHDAHFISDHAFPEHVVRLTQGAMLHVPPGRLTKWSVLRNIGPVPDYYTLLGDRVPDSIINPVGATWDPAQTVPLDQSLVNGMLGIPGFGGNLVSLAPEHKARLRAANDFYKTHRAALARSVARPLTPIRLVNEHRGWVAFQLTDEQTDTHFLYVFRFYETTNDTVIRPLGLSPDKTYTLTRAFHEEGPIEPLARTGQVWGTDGFSASVRWHGGAIWRLA
jgi:hypothetical protein